MVTGRWEEWKIRWTGKENETLEDNDEKEVGVGDRSSVDGSSGGVRGGGGSVEVEWYGRSFSSSGGKSS